MKNTYTHRICLGSILLISIACGDDTSETIFAVGTTTVAPQFAVVMTDYQDSSMVALLDEDGDILVEEFISSRTNVAGLSNPMSGDVVVARNRRNNRVTVLDRSLSTANAIDYTTGDIQQVLTQSPQAAFVSNPQAMLYVSDTSAWVTRREPNLDSEAESTELGGDLYEVDPSSFTRTLQRIDLASVFRVEVTGTQQDEPAQTFVEPHPVSIVQVRNTMVVGLDRLEIAPVRAVAPGAIALVDIDTKSVTSFELPNAQNCGQVVPVPNEPDLVAVGCLGFSTPFGVAEQVLASSGLFILRINNSSASIERSWVPTSTSALSVVGITAIDSNTVTAFAYGDFSAGTPDRYFLIDLETGTQTQMFETQGPFNTDSGAFSPQHNLFIAPDASVVAIRRFQWNPATKTMTELSQTPIGRVPENLLPRRVQFLGPNQ